MSVLVLCFVVICSICIYVDASDKRYTLYKTDNMYTFLKLDTRTGQIWQVHWSIDEDNRIVLPVSTEILSLDIKDGRFALFSTNNMYNFILLDTLNGKTWQVQWSFKEENRLIIPINPQSNTKETQKSAIDIL
ncbi:MAG: hypothetical protein J6T23_04980 [Elusimicrobia bacterium]|nr:hypothetical protein [Elusimicrobiota bacterium]